MNTKEIVDAFSPYIVYFILVYLGVLVVCYIGRRQMLLRAQHIIDLVNKRQGCTFSLSPLTLSLNIIKTGNAELLINTSTDL
jgi:hypothetical protein